MFDGVSLHSSQNDKTSQKRRTNMSSVRRERSKERYKGKSKPDVSFADERQRRKLRVDARKDLSWICELSS